MNEKYKFIVSLFLGVILIGIIIAEEIKIRNHSITNLRNTILIVAVIGIIMCCICKAVQVNGWGNPFAITCALLGVMLLLLIANLFIERVKIDDRVSFRILYSITILKWVLTNIHHIINIIK